MSTAATCSVSTLFLEPLGVASATAAFDRLADPASLRHALEPQLLLHPHIPQLLNLHHHLFKAGTSSCLGHCLQIWQRLITFFLT